jgi:hypothetical protein
MAGTSPTKPALITAAEPRTRMSGVGGYEAISPRSRSDADVAHRFGGPADLHAGLVVPGGRWAR